MTAVPIPLLERSLGADDLRAAIDEAVQRALGRFADRATITPEELSEVMGWGRSTSYEACRTGVVPCVRVGRRVLVIVPGLVALLLGTQISDGAGLDTDSVNDSGAVTHV